MCIERLLSRPRAPQNRRGRGAEGANKLKEATPPPVATGSAAGAYDDDYF